MRLDIHLDRRQALVRTLIGLGAGGITFAPQKALAGYTIIPTGSIAGKEAALAEAMKKFEANPDDPYVFGEKAQLECASRTNPSGDVCVSNPAKNTCPCSQV